MSLVTPEGVVLEFETAGVATRILAGAVDLAIQVVLLLAVSFGALAVAAAGADGGIGAAFVYIAVFLVLFGYPAAFETLWRGRTPGKALLGIRAVTVEGAPVRFRHAAVRAIVALLDKLLMFGVIGILTILVTARNQRLGDLAAGTLVLRERTGAPPPVAVTFSPPPGLESFAASLDLAALGDERYLLVRSFLLRAHEMAPRARWDLARRLADDAVGRVRTSPPPGTQPEQFLLCIAAEYQRRG